jgi:S1-C subfamily serine protease
MIIRALCSAVLLFISLALHSAPAWAGDDISAASRSVVRVVVVAVVDGRVVGFGHGSGFAISDTKIVTNAHVVELAAKYPDNVAIGAVPSEGKGAVPARILAVDEARDLALIEITKGGIPPTAIYSGAVESGTKVTALGYPGNVDAAAARGLLDKIEPRAPVRSDGNVSNPEEVNGTPVLTHTAAIARGNSGGPLVDECGRVVGVNTFITRADDGDAPFGFAVMASELIKFLGEHGVKPPSVGVACEPLDEAAAREREEQAKAEEEARKKQDAEDKAAQIEREERMFAIQAERENRMALAAVLLVLGALSAGASLVFLIQKNERRVRLAGAVAGVLIVAAALAFLTRPALNANALVSDPAQEAAKEAAAESPKPEADAASPAKPASDKRSFTCVIDLERSRVTISQTNDVPVSIDKAGCVNGRTQYAEMDGGDWQRVLVPNEDATVAVVDFNPDAKSYRVSRYLLDAENMAEARKLRPDIKQCTKDAAAVVKLTEAQNAIRAILPEQANERLVYRCSSAK